ncbi:MAG: DUF4397 domain-containing protein [Nocardioidaceae bacterium]
MPLAATSRPLAALALVAATVLTPSYAVADRGDSVKDGSAAPRSEVYVIQGLPGSTVDVILDGKSLRTGVKPKAILGPLGLSRGEHTIDFEADNWSISSSFDVSRASTDVVLHWPADVTAKPEVTVFDNAVAAIAPDKGRLTVAHTAVVPPADVRVNGKVLFANIANGEFVTAEVSAESYSVAIVPTGQVGPALLGPVKLPVAEGKLTRVFAIGEPRNGSMDAVVQTLPLPQSGSQAPNSVPAGEAGLVAARAVSAASASSPQASFVRGIAAVALSLGALAAVGWLRRRPRAIA